MVRLEAMSRITRCTRSMWALMKSSGGCQSDWEAHCSSAEVNYEPGRGDCC